MEDLDLGELSEKSGVSQGSVLRLVLFNIFTDDIDNESKCTLSKFADDVKLSSAADSTEGQDAIQGYLEKLDMWAHDNLMKLDKSKCKMLHLVLGKLKHEYCHG